MSHSSIFITGTNTGVGKTFTSALIMAAGMSQRFPLRYFKPIQTGDESDCDTVKTLASLDEEAIIRPIFAFQMPATPYLAAAAENKIVKAKPIIARFEACNTHPCVIEGAGGLLTPLGENLLLRDVIRMLSVPLLIVATTQLGTMNHTLLTVEAARAANIPIKGLVLSGKPYPGLVEILQEFTALPILAEVPQLDSVSPESVKKTATSIFDMPTLRRIFS